DRKAKVEREIHEREAICSIHRDHVEILRNPPIREPHGNGGAADEKPITDELLTHRENELQDSLVIEHGLLGVYFSSMDGQLNLLASAGLPIGAARRPARRMVDREPMIRALNEAFACTDGDELTPYAAWLSAWSHHWPASFAATFGLEGPAYLARAKAG